jgi:hypothetical protein
LKINFFLLFALQRKGKALNQFFQVISYMKTLEKCYILAPTSFVVKALWSNEPSAFCACQQFTAAAEAKTNDSTVGRRQVM